MSLSLIPHYSSLITAFPLSRSAFTASMRRGVLSLFVTARRATLVAANVTLRAVRGLCARTHHLGKQVYIIVGFARHLLADRVKHFEKSRLAIHSSSIVNRKS